MATHTIKYPDYSRGDEPRAIVWDDETGEVTGDHVEVPAIRDAMERAERDGHLPEMFGRRNLRDPRHDPADFLAVLDCVILAIPFRWHLLDLPPALHGVEPTPWTSGPLSPGAVY